MPEQLGFHRARGDGHHPHVVRRQFFAQVLRQAMYGKLAADIGHMVGEGLAPGHGADVDQGAVPTLTHAADQRMHAVEQAFDVDVEHALPLLRVLIVHLPQQHHPGIVHQRIGWAMQGFGLLYGGNQRRAVADIHGAAQAVGQRQRLQALQAPGDQQQRVAGGSEQAGSGRADAGTGAGDDDEGLVHDGLRGIIVFDGRNSR